MPKKTRIGRSQGAFEYILLLGGVLLIVVVAIIILRGSVLNGANQQIGGNVNAWQDVTDASCYVSNYFLGTDLPDVSFEKGVNGWSGQSGCAYTVQDCTTSYDGSCSLRSNDVIWTRPKDPYDGGCIPGGTDYPYSGPDFPFGPISISEYKYLTFYYKLTAGSNACFMANFAAAGSGWNWKRVAHTSASANCLGSYSSISGVVSLIADGNWHYAKINLGASGETSYGSLVLRSDGVAGNYFWFDSYCARK